MNEEFHKLQQLKDFLIKNNNNYKQNNNKYNK